MTEKTMNKNHINNKIDEVISRYWNIAPKFATDIQIYRALCIVMREILLEKRYNFKQEIDTNQKKQVYYMCMEFLIGKSLKNNLFNLNLENEVSESLKKYNVNLDDLYKIEKDPGLGNGGLGRLAACFLDSLATQNYPVTGFSIKYEFGLFKQKIIEGWQTELPDDWLSTSDIWLVPRTEERVVVNFDGEIKEEWTNEGLIIKHINTTEVEAIPYDVMISGYQSKGVSLLRLWEARSLKSIDMNLFSQGEYIKALSEDSMAEAISKILYPADNHSEGKILRIKQQYFLVSASAQNIVNDHYKKYNTLDNFCDKVAIHINDTHPALIIPELMRIFMDEYFCPWDKAWYMVTNSVSYTNHTVLQEALETLEIETIKTKLPRIYSIIQEINQRFMHDVSNKYSGKMDKANQMSLFSYGKINMANISIVGSHSINGVAKLHSEILKNTIFKNFYEYNPNKFTNITNGITHRRWLNQANPELKNLINDLIGTSYYLNPENLSLLKKYKDNEDVLLKIDEIKYNNKLKLTDYIYKKNNIIVDPDSIFDIQAKRLHEYKRQLLNILRIISIIIDITEGKTDNVLPETFIFAAKAAPSYYRAKEIIHLICTLSDFINANSVIKEYINVVFIENYSVSLAEIIIPAGEISEQISLAGKEASGTGNMKFMLNGALTLGTYDGANIEILEQVGKENFFLFGMQDYEVEKLWRNGYNSVTYYQQNKKIRKIIDFLNKGINGKSFESISKYLLGVESVGDPYMCFADFEDYMNVHYKTSQIYYNNKMKWNQMSLINIASAGIFSSDRTVKEYSKKIWNIEPIE
ncbi:starch phosphorylase [Sedimentibacter acidaminivorans]|uniref:Alpha-1,4 glucan phosphorylase n=1 Tax=Sedimentibacter acidaminivorans TaxID=913099 RepID=A0ABS4GFI2_9FIRM|nr:glycogen/starch/alpha-glucan phosphorylase [Sedimentibacter acidaminivorans]MBP1926451.1 starch phosphorylase [Sedimentibacter acidaminivorans]